MKCPGGRAAGSDSSGFVFFVSTYASTPLPARSCGLVPPRFLKQAGRAADDQSVAPSTLPTYDPRVIELFADKLYRKASSFVGGSIVVGGALGAAFGAVPLTSLGNAWPIPSAFGIATLLVGALSGAVVGYVIGDTRSFGYRLQAQAALCQLQIERNTALVAAAASAARETPTVAPPPQQQQQQQEPPVSAARVA
jgi:hypothetical protein